MNAAKLLEVATLEVDCKIGKDRHFIAADRKNRWRIALGLFAVIGTAMMSSGIGPAIKDLILRLSAGYHDGPMMLEVLGHVVPLLVGVSTAVVGFLGLEKQTTQHRYVGNAYIEIARRARSIINASNNDPNLDGDLVAEYDKLLTRYLEVNAEGESCPTNKRDSERAMRMNDVRRIAIKGKLAESDRAKLGISEVRPAPTLSILNALVHEAKRKMLRLLLATGLIRRSDARRCVRSLG